MARLKSPDSLDICEWPEYKAFAKRLGIDTSRPTIKLVLTLEVGYPTEIEHRYLGVDEPPITAHESESQQ